jgi:hypothetical protein
MFFSANVDIHLVQIAVMFIYGFAQIAKVEHQDCKFMENNYELTTTGKQHSTGSNLASHVSRANLGTVGNSIGSVRKRTGPLPPLANLVEMERNLDNYGRMGIQACIIPMIVALILIWEGFWELLGY